jgi:Effector-associated domain 8/NACHT domain
MVKLDRSTINELVEVLKSFVETEKERQSFLITALGNDAPVLQHISWGGSVATFIPHMVAKLADFGGRQALCTVLEYARLQMGAYEDVQKHIDKLVRQLNLPTSTASDVSNIDVLVQKVRKGLYNKIQNLHGTIQLLDIAHPVEIDRLYVDVNILEEPCNYSRLEIGELSRGRDQREDFNRFGLPEVRERVTGLQAVEKHPKLMILGKPGSGKTTFLQHVVIECNQGYLLAEYIPILIRLRDFVRQAKRVNDFSLDFHISSFLGEIVSQQEITALLTGGKFLLLLDGLDEVPEENSDTVIDEIEFFLDSYDQNNFIITCRVQAQKYRLNRFNYVEVADFNSEQILKFAGKWFAANSGNGLQESETKSSKFMELFNLPENKNIQELAVTPILLSLTCRVFDDKGKFYSKPTELYEQALEILLSKWDDSRRIKRNSVYQNFSVEHKRKLLSYLAARKFEQEQYMLFEQDEIQGYIAEYLDISLEDSQVLLESIESKHGLIVERAQRIYSFSHLTFQEYFVAKWFVDRADWQRLVKHIYDKHWQEVFFFAMATMISADNLVCLMKQKIDCLLAKDNKCQRFLLWAHEKSCLVNLPFRLASIRAFYFDLGRSINLAIDNLQPNPVVAFFADDFKPELAFFLGFDKNIDSYRLSDVYLDMELACAFSDAPTKPNIKDFDIEAGLKDSLEQLETKVLDDYASHMFLYQNNYEDDSWQSTWINEVKVLAENLRVKSIEYRNIGHQWHFSSEQEELLQQYYDANLLLINCLNCACLINGAVRQEIEDTLLLPIAEIDKYNNKQRDLEQ